MNAAVQSDFITVDEYLRYEEESLTRHEYLGGAVFAMAGASDNHNQIAGSFYAALRQKLRNGPCRVFMSDMRMKVLPAGREVFFYPDVMVTCDPRDSAKLFKEHPKLVIEVLSESTERTDRFEKFLIYREIESLDEYVHAAQDRAEVTIFRRANDWNREVFTKLDDQLELRSVGLNLSLREIYEGVNLS